MTTDVFQDYDLEEFVKVSKELRSASALLSRGDVRYLVSMYYEVQEQRIRADAQLKRSQTENNPVIFLAEQWNKFEKNAKKCLKAYAESDSVGRWSMGIVGIGPVIAAGLLAHIDIEMAPTVGHIWNFAGQNPKVKWEAKTKRPWNADLKLLCWKAGESFVMFHNNKNDVYGKIYVERKELEIERNARGENAEQAKQILSERNFRADTVARPFYEKGELPPGHIHARAKRYAVKLFLSHWHHVAYVERYGTEPAIPFILSQVMCPDCLRVAGRSLEDTCPKCGSKNSPRPLHTNYIKPPNYP